MVTMYREVSCNPGPVAAHTACPQIVFPPGADRPLPVHGRRGQPHPACRDTSIAPDMDYVLPDGTALSLPDGATGADAAAAIGPGLARAALAIKVDGELRDLSRALPATINATARRSSRS